MTAFRNVSAVLLAAVVASLALTATAAAHATLESTQPASGANLKRAPQGVTFRFSEPVEARFGAVRIYSETGARIDTGRVTKRDGGRTLVAALRPGARDGRFVASFRLISADGHPISGGLTFSAGAGAGAGAASATPADNRRLQRLLLAGDESGGVTRTAFSVVRALDYLAIAVAVGLCAFLLICWRPALARAAGADPAWTQATRAFARAATRLLYAAIALGALTTYLGIVFQGAVAGGTSLWGALSVGTVADTVATQFGSAWAMKFWVWVLFAVALTRVAPQRALVLRPVALGADGRLLGPPDRGRMLLLLVPALALLVVPALSGHASSQGSVALAVPSTVVHVAAMSTWVGGLIALAVLVPRALRELDDGADRTRLLAAVALRFSPLALVCVAALVATGTVQSIVYLDAPRQLVEDAFGRAVLIKIALVAALCVLGAVNRRRALPVLAAAVDRTGDLPGRANDAARLLRRMVRTEVALVAGVLAVTGALVGYSPSASSSADAAGPAVVPTGPGGTLGFTASAGPARLRGTYDPARKVLRVRVQGAEVEEVQAAARLPGQTLGAITTAMTGRGEVFTARPMELVPPGDWRVKITVRVSEFDEYSAVVTLPVAR